MKPTFALRLFPSLILCCLIPSLTSTAMGQIPDDAQLSENLSNESVEVFASQNTLWLRPRESGFENGKISIPRLCAPIRSIAWASGVGSEIKFTPEPTEWFLSFAASQKQGIIRIELDATPTTLDQAPATTPAADGSVLLHAYQATTHGTKLRFEPQWYKNTVGYWTVPTDYASWQFVVEQPGRYVVAILQGCGAGQGGSDAKLSVLQDDSVSSEIEFKTKETGHFQNFRWHEIGELKIDSKGTYELRVQPQKIAAAALFDIRMIHLIRQAN